MNCPRCGESHENNMIATPKTRRYDEIDIRQHECLTCGMRWTSVAKIDIVYVFDPTTMKVMEVSLDEYKKKYLDLDLRRGKYKIQIGMFDEHQ